MRHTDTPESVRRVRGTVSAGWRERRKSWPTNLQALGRRTGGAGQSINPHKVELPLFDGLGTTGAGLRRLAMYEAKQAD
jgi:hypothetical protein